MDELDELEKLDQIIKNEKTEDFYNSADDDDEDYNSDSEYIFSEYEDDGENESFNFDSNLSEEVVTEGFYIEPTVESIKPHISSEMYNIIHSCTDLKLQKVLIMNRIKAIQTNSLKQQYLNMVDRCNKSIEIAIAKCYTSDVKYSYESFKSHIRCPFFRDCFKFAPKPNADTLKKIQNEELQASDLLRSITMWFPKRQVELKVQVLTNYYIKTNRGQVNSVSELQKDMMSVNLDEIQLPPLGDDRFIDWERISQSLFSTTNYAALCRAAWNQLVHPLLNKSNMNRNEEEHLLKLVAKYGRQCWDKVSDELFTNRSSLFVCRYYGRMKHYRKRYTEAENSEMIELVERYRDDSYIPWIKIAMKLNRPKGQLIRHYNWLQGKGDVKTGQFTLEEDVRLLFLVNKYGMNFKAIAAEMPQRSEQQLKVHYQCRFVNPTSRYGYFTIEEDRMIMDYAKKNEDKNVCFKKLERILNRKAVNLRHRYAHIIKKLEANPGWTLEDVPRKSIVIHKYAEKRKTAIVTAQHYVNLGVIPTLPLDYAKDKKYGRPVRSQVDLDLIAYFRNTAHIRKVRRMKSVTTSAIESCAESIHDTLNNFNALINICDNQLLDETDHDIINILREKQRTKSESKIIPPNINTMQIFNALLLQTEQFFRQRSKEEVLKAFNNMYNESPALQQFYKRLRAMLYLPCVMSVINPPTNLIYDCEATSEETDVPVSIQVVENVPKKKGRKRKAEKMGKVHLMNAARALKRNKEKDESEPSTSQQTSSDVTHLKVNNVPVTEVSEVHNIIEQLNKMPGQSTKYLVKIDSKTFNELQKRKVRNMPIIDQEQNE